MCSYKVVKVFFEVWGLQGKVESGVHKVRGYNFKEMTWKSRSILLVGEICYLKLTVMCVTLLWFSFRLSRISYFAVTSRHLCGWMSGMVRKHELIKFTEI